MSNILIPKKRVFTPIPRFIDLRNEYSDITFVASGNILPGGGKSTMMKLIADATDGYTLSPEMRVFFGTAIKHPEAMRKITGIPFTPPNDPKQLISYTTKYIWDIILSKDQWYENYIETQNEKGFAERELCNLIQTLIHEPEKLVFARGNVGNQASNETPEAYASENATLNTIALDYSPFTPSIAGNVHHLLDMYTPYDINERRYIERECGTNPTPEHEEYMRYRVGVLHRVESKFLLKNPKGNLYYDNTIEDDEERTLMRAWAEETAPTIRGNAPDKTF